MQTPGPAAWPGAEAGAQSEGLTPGVSVAAANADTPRSPSPGQDLAGGAAGEGSQPPAAATAAAAPVAAAGEQLAAPLHKPTLRVQGGDIILEDATSPHHRTSSNSEAHAARRITKLVSGASSTAAVAGAAAGQPSSRQGHHQGDALDTDLLQRRLSRNTTGNSMRAQAASRQPTQVDLSGGQDVVAVAGLPRANGGEQHMLRHRGDIDPTLAAAAASSEAHARMKYRSTLTEENVSYQSKLGQYSGRMDPSERMWRWLEDAGPPYEVQPSLGVPPAPARQGSAVASAAAAAKRQQGSTGGSRARRLWCGCFGGS